MSRLLGAAALVVVLHAVAPAQAQQAGNRGQASRWCLSPRGVSVDMTIAGCSYLIEAGPLQGGTLFFPYLQRGLARAEKGEFEAAYRDFEAAEAISPEDARPAIARERIRQHLRQSQ
jgi:hypothetical protein